MFWMRKIRLNLEHYIQKHTLRQSNITTENHHFQWVNQLFLWPFSIAMVNIGKLSSMEPPMQGLVNVLVEHHPIIGNIISNRYLVWWCSKSPKMDIYQPLPYVLCVSAHVSNRSSGPGSPFPWALQWHQIRGSVHRAAAPRGRRSRRSRRSRRDRPARAGRWRKKEQRNRGISINGVPNSWMVFGRENPI